MGSTRFSAARSESSVMAMAQATASVCVNDSDSGSSRTPCSAATSFARPDSTTEGRPLALRRTSMSRTPMPRVKPVPSAFTTASFAAKRVA